MDSRPQNPIPLNEAARLFALSSRTVRRLVENGDLTAIRIGSTLALPPEALPDTLRGSIGNAPAEPLLTRHEVAARLRCSPRTVRDLTASGELRSIRIGGSVRWAPGDVDGLRAKVAAT